MSSLQKCEPPTQELVATVEGFDIGETAVELSLDNDECVGVTKDILEAALEEAGMSTSMDTLSEIGPLVVTLKLSGNTVLSMTVTTPE